jgi:hypothetical protein
MALLVLAPLRGLFLDEAPLPFGLAGLPVTLGLPASLFLPDAVAFPVIVAAVVLGHGSPLLSLVAALALDAGAFLGGDAFVAGTFLGQDLLPAPFGFLGCPALLLALGVLPRRPLAFRVILGSHLRTNLR